MIQLRRAAGWSRGFPLLCCGCAENAAANWYSQGCRVTEDKLNEANSRLARTNQKLDKLEELFGDANKKLGTVEGAIRRLQGGKP